MAGYPWLAYGRRVMVDLWSVALFGGGEVPLELEASSTVRSYWREYLLFDGVGGAPRLPELSGRGEFEDGMY